MDEESGKGGADGGAPGVSNPGSSNEKLLITEKTQKSMKEEDDEP